MGTKISAADNSITFNFESSVKTLTQDFIKDTVWDIYNRANKNQAFFDGLKFNVSALFDNIPESKSGYTKYPIADKEKNIYIQTGESTQYDPFSIHPQYTEYSRIKETTLHELGHIFDFYFANPNPEIKEKLQTILSSKDISDKTGDKEFYELLKLYVSQNGLSDSEEYKEAWRSDVEREFKGKLTGYNNIKVNNLAYFSPKLKNENMYKKDIILEDGINDKELQQADKAREEVFAQLFAYALGANADSYEKYLITKTYGNSYKVVKQYITEYLGIDTSNSTKLNTRF